MTSQLVEDRTALQDVMLRYATGVDDRDRALYEGCFTDDVEVLDFGNQTFRGKAAWMAYVWSALGEYSSTQHMLSPQLAEVNGDTAHTRNDVQALHYFTEGEHTRFILWATYFTDMRRDNGEWKIYRHRLVSRGSQLE